MEIRVTLNIKPEYFQAYYEGRVSSVQTMSSDGRRVCFPASILRPFVTREGVCGRFALQVDKKGKLLSIARLSSDKLH